MLIAAPILGNSICKDYESGFSQILFTTPIKKDFYFFTRLLASLISILIILSSAGFGIWLATHMPFVNRSLLIQNHFSFYLAPYLTTIFPNMVFWGSIFIAIASFFKKMSAVYIASIILLVGHMISGTLLADLDNRFFAAMLDPLGSASLQEIIRYWSITEQNTRVISLSGVFLYNRVLWTSIGSLLLLIGYSAFNPYKLVKEKKKNTSSFCYSFSLEPEIHQNPKSLRGFFLIAFSEFRQAFLNIHFLLILLCGILFLVLYSSQVGKIFGTETLPVTYQALDMTQGSFQLFMMILTIYYAGELVWKDREKSFFEIVDSKPVSNLYLYSTKLLSLIFLQIFFAILILITGIVIQISKRYYFFELDIYFQGLFIYFLLPNLFICLFSLFAQTISKSKFIGHSIVIFVFAFMAFISQLGFNHKLYLLGELPIPDYSDMNQFGSSLYSFMMFALYWGLFFLMLASLTVLSWLRGVIGTWKTRLKECKTRIRKIHKAVFSTTCCCWILLGIFMFYNTNIINDYKLKSTQIKETVNYEVLYKKFEKDVQPEIISARFNIDLFPKKHGLHADGLLTYRNTSDQPIKILFLNADKDVSLHWGKEAMLKHQDQRLSVFIFELKEPLQPDEEIQLSFQLEDLPKGISNSQFPSKILDNGTFFYGSDYFPIMGYLTSRELASDKIRRKHGLCEKPLMNDIHDQDALQRTYISHEGSWIDFEAIVSTSKDQIAIAPGYLQKEWEQDNRRFFHYKMDKPMLNFYAFLSGRYEVAVDQWNDVKIEIYHHPTHTANVPRMIQAIKKSLDYYTHHFSPYQFKQLRIIEFPRYSTFAQSFPNTVPFSEGIGFIAKIDESDPECIDYVFYVTAHEVAHQWWAHQVIGGDVQGSTMLSESLAQYSALMVQEKEYGPEQMRKFLKYEMDNYLAGRALESMEEEPLMLNSGQQYIHYNKGSLVFYALKDYLGEEAVNKVLREYIKDVAFQKPPFTRSVDLVDRFKLATPEDKKYLIEDFFETITFYSNQTQSAHVIKKDDQFEVVITSINKKFKLSDLGVEHEVPMDDYVDIGVFDEKGYTLYLEKHKAQSGENVFHIQVERMPHKAGVDPINKLIDKDPKNHLVKVVAASP
ncbi:MAG: M1 family aminopeptidase [Simkaniaceae bacterium]|nr:M1 family aminopeptidase [Candidatus Sacchlamyda saccharinae]